MNHTPRIGDRVYWEPMTPGSPLQYGTVSSVFPMSEADAYRISVNWDVSDGEGRHETVHHFTPRSHVKFVEKEPSNV